MNESELRELIRTELGSQSCSVNDVVRKAVHETLITMGMDATDPIQLQADMAFIRELRSTSEKVKSKGLLALVGIIVAAVAGATWLGLKSSVG